MIKSAYAANEILNNALPARIRDMKAGEGIAFYISTLWKTVVIVGGLAFLLFLVWGGVEWLTASGDKGKLEEAQKKISNALTGLVILVGSYAIVRFVQFIFDINLLNPFFPNNL